MRIVVDINYTGAGMDCQTKRQRQTRHACSTTGQLDFWLVNNCMGVVTVLGDTQIKKSPNGDFFTTFQHNQHRFLF